MEKAPFPTEDSKETSLDKAVMIIGEIRQQVAVMGGNDFEIPALDDLLKALTEGECTPEEAVHQAHLIIDRKADYH
ncbi:MAG: hypothetical protein NTX96_02330 [Candidatus Zambryskibacteria bacterium]|nr:hypothetical protein [Candidatus Zambryskibacteria bacterium]